MSSPFFTVICPFFNAEKYLDESVQSVIKQSCTNWELILLDDGSEDGGLQKANNWSERDERIKVFQHPGGMNKGVSASRNLGIKHAKAPWVAFLDADDVWLPEKLEKQQKAIKQVEEKDLVLIYCPTKVIDETGEFITERGGTKDHNPMFGIYGAGRPGFQENAFRWVIDKGFEAPTSSVVCRKDIIQQLGGFEEDMRFSEDALMWYRILENGNMFFIEEPLVQYRVHLSQWNAAATTKLKLTRRFIVYERLLQKTNRDHKSYVSFLLVNKGFRIITRSYIGYPYFNFKIIGKYWKKVLKNDNVLFAHKIFSLLISVTEIIILPVRLMRGIVK